MATLTVRNLDEALIRALRIRAAEHGRSAEAEHRAILQQALTGSGSDLTRAAVAERLEAFRRRTAGRGSAPATDLLRESRKARSADLAGGAGA
jgi:plasmid stability protein